MVAPVDTAPRREETPTPHKDVDWLGLLETACGESCDLGQHRRLAKPGKDKFPSPGQKSFNIGTIATNRGRERRSPGSIPPRRRWKPHPHWVVANLRRLMEPARGQSCPSGQRRHPAALRIRFYSRMRTPSITLQLQLPANENIDRPGRYRPAR